jgi:large subunit ribosomal protein L15
MPLARRLPKRGFHSPFKTEFQVVNVESLERLATGGKVLNGLINPELLVKLGAVKKRSLPVKILGTGELKTKLDVSAHAFSKSAIQKIEAAGGKAQTLSSNPKE